ncbi:MAG: hypothetical protein E6K80_07955 [Candidatus Eisenbacteria bacterium]|uniref:Porin n=1 Tax=Eiseniibacteriota bacterium TaxID=2212470 RepID=A0A538U416_UNCEI|nr:MAG: hypothetical protein E6K80_07955 [Candidatus Eisenbacteria bacterium]
MRFLLRSTLLIILLAAALPAHAQWSGDSGLTPRVPVSALARPAAWLDPSRMQISSEFSFGSGFGGPAQGLQVTSLVYRIGDPLAMRVSLGNTFGAPGARGSSPFLEGIDLAYQPFRSLLIQVRYQDVRSPLQYSRGPFAPWR